LNEEKRSSDPDFGRNRWKGNQQLSGEGIQVSKLFFFVAEDEAK
jgi:hypothetical protein